MASVVEELERLVKLRDTGDLTPQEFEALKARLIGLATNDSESVSDQDQETGSTPSERFLAAKSKSEPSDPHVCDHCGWVAPERSALSKFGRHNLLKSSCPECGRKNSTQIRDAPSQQLHVSVSQVLPTPRRSQATVDAPKPSTKEKRPIRAWVWVLATLGAIAPMFSSEAILLDVVIGGAAMFFIGWLIDRAIK